MPRKPKSPKAEIKSSPFVDALKFVGLITKDIGSIGETHVMLQNNWVSAFNGVLSAGHKITEDLHAAPQNKLMIDALSKCGDNLSITQLDNNRLSIKSNKFKALVPCIEQFLLQTTMPDPKIAVIDNRLKTSFEQISKLTLENGVDVEYRSILLNNYSVIATIGSVIFEAWHGIHMPENISIPKSVVQPLIKTNKNFVGFGFSPSSVTFHFEDESWIKTQTYAEKWRDVSDVMKRPCAAGELPPDFYAGLTAVAPFSSDGNVYFAKDVLQSHLDASMGAQFEMQGLPAGPIFSIKNLMLIKDHIRTIDFLAPGPNNRMLKFYGNSIMGVVAGQIR